MHNPPAISRDLTPPRRRPTTTSVPVPQRRAEAAELRALLEANLHALQAVFDEHHLMLERGLQAMDELRAELRAIGDCRAPWVQALSETRALLYVALRELIVGNDEAGLSIQLPRQVSHRSR